MASFHTASEEMLYDLFHAEWNDPHAQKYGRKGQRQYGVDIFGQLGQQGGLIGVQAKEKDLLSASSLAERELVNEVEKAKSFDPPLADFIIATTGPRDQKIQKKARLITQDPTFRSLLTGFREFGSVEPSTEEGEKCKQQRAT